MIRSIGKRLTVVSTPRSGHHGVANWILRQHTGLGCMFTASTIQPVPIQPTELPHAYEHWWYEENQRAYKDNQKIANQTKIHSSESHLDISVVMDCYERETLQEVSDYYRNTPTTMIIVLRNVFNTIASMIKRRPQAPFFNMDVWKSLAREATRDSQDKFVVILFDRWHIDQEYRELIAQKLGIEFTDKGRNEILTIGRGSSFDTINSDGRAQEMDVLNRYKDVINHPTVINKVLSDREALELNEILFGEFMSTHSI